MKTRIIHIGRYSENANEGGQVRDNVFYRLLSGMEDVETINVYRRNLFKMIKILLVFLLKTNTTLLLHITSFGIPISNRNILSKIARKIYLILLRRSSKRNKIIFEINDLYVEQARDLELEVPYYHKEIEDVIFRLENTDYVFASELMRDYIVGKYDISVEKTFVCINGDNPIVEIKLAENLERILSRETIKFVYAGTLNKGRQIEKMIAIFKHVKDIDLILIGINGEWIEKIEKGCNIIYLGAFTEEVAHYIVSKCDIGVIPYDSKRFYYNIAFPTKLSTYITAGIPFLSTDTETIKRISNANKKIGWVTEIEEWDEVIKSINRNDLQLAKENVNDIKINFYWQTILNEFYIKIAPTT